MSDKQSTVLGCAISIGFTIGIFFLLSLATSCAHLPAPTVEVAGKQVVLEQGLRGKECIEAPKTIEAAAKRFDVTCVFAGDGPASCQYFMRVDAIRSWLCSIAYYQHGCKEQWVMQEMNCMPWADKFHQLIPHSYEEQQGE